MSKPTITSFGTHAILLQWSSEINEKIHEEVLRYNRYISNEFSEKIIETVCAYQSMVVYIKQNTNQKEFINRLKSVTKLSFNNSKEASTIWQIPVCYAPEYGVDLYDVAAYNNISENRVIKLHTSTIYRIYFMGFLPGFLYLGGLHKSLNTPRKEKPSSKVLKGAVGIGGEQTGIYPMECPGGWNIIGRSPISLFDVNANPPSLFLEADSIQFYAVSKKQYQEIEQEIINNNYQLKREKL